jgi:polyferredoxin
VLLSQSKTAGASAAGFLLTLSLLGAVQLWAPRPMLLLERAFAGGGWIEALLLATYAAVVIERLHDVQAAPRWRRRIWTLFSILFFAQLALGLAGLDGLLMRPDRLHFPIPALIVAGPIYRGGGVFMLVLFLVSLLLVGPAWCSHICYLGAWDNAAAATRRKPRPLPGWAGPVRVTLTVLVIGAAILLRLLGASVLLAGALALAFGLLGVAVMLLASRRTGTMVHCSVYCPIGLLAGWLGRISPFRIRIGDGCDSCMRCSLACRYGALTARDVERRRPSTLCTLCGDCLASCPGQQLGYRFGGLGPARARTLFIVLVVTLHAATLGLARI